MSQMTITTKPTTDEQSSCQVKGGGKENNFCYMMERGHLHMFLMQTNPHAK